jgi:hypothetical protein
MEPVGSQEHTVSPVCKKGKRIVRYIVTFIMFCKVDEMVSTFHLNNNTSIFNLWLFATESILMKLQKQKHENIFVKQL